MKYYFNLRSKTEQQPALSATLPKQMIGKKQK